MSALERLRGYREVASHKIHKPVTVATPDLADPDTVYATEILKSEGVLHAASVAIKRHLHRHPFHHAKVDISTIHSAEGAGVSPVAEIHVVSDNPDHPLGTFLTRVNVVWHTLTGADARKGVARVLHSIHNKSGAEEESSAPIVWQDLVLPPDRQDMSLEEQIGLAVSRANGEQDGVTEIKSDEVAERPAIELE